MLADAAAIARADDPDWRGGAGPSRYGGRQCQLFDLLDARPVVGRTFRADDNRPGSPKIAILSYGMWQQRFGRDPKVIGRRVMLDGVATEIVGVIRATPRDARVASRLYALPRCPNV
jgi:hypothetical protein